MACEDCEQKIMRAGMRHQMSVGKGRECRQAVMNTHAHERVNMHGMNASCTLQMTCNIDCII